MWKKKWEGEEKEKKMHTEGGEKNGPSICLLSVGDKHEILKFIFNAINCLMKHNNLSC